MYKYARNNKGIVELYAKLPSGFNGFGFENSSAETQQKNGFYTINYPQLEEYQSYTYKLIPSDFNLKLKQWVMPIVKKTDEEIAEIEQSSKKTTRNQLLKDGVVVRNIWFDKSLLVEFLLKVQMYQSEGATEVEWGLETGWATITIEEAYLAIKEAEAYFTSLYKDYA